MKRTILRISMIVTGVLLIALLLFWILHWRFIESTRDAYVNGNQVVVTSQIEGYVQGVFCQDTQQVQAGDLLISLDQTDSIIALEQAKKELADSVRNYVSLQERAASLQAQKQIQISNFIRTGQDYIHRKKLIDAGAVSIEDFEHAEAAFVAAFAATLLAEHELKGAEAQIVNTTVETHPRVVEAKQSVRQAYVNWKRCEIRAPTYGMVARKTVQVGESISPRNSLLIIIPFDQMWVDANFKEVQLKNVRPGLPVKVWADLYGGSVCFHGRVLDINAGTGSVFSVLPPQNATGNWIKIVQRLAVRIALDPHEVQRYPLRLGLSMKAKIDVRSPMQKMEDKAQFETNVFSDQEEGVDQLINQIIAENAFWNPSP